MSNLIQKKICMLGDFAVGKTSLVERFVYNRFSDRYLSTIGVKIARKSMPISAEEQLNLLIWDLAGSEEFAGIQSSYLHGTTGALLVCDLTRGNTLDSLRKYKERLDDISPNADIVILGNKSDLIARLEIEPKQIEQLAKELEAPYYITSAKSGAFVEEAFQKLADSVLSHA